MTGPQSPRADREAGDRRGAAPLPGRLVDRPHLHRRAGQAGVLREVDVPAGEGDLPALRHDLRRLGRLPVEELVEPPERERRGCALNVGRVGDRHVLCALDLTAGRGQRSLGRPQRERPHAPWGRAHRHSVDAHIVGDVRRALRRAVEVVLHQLGAERVREQIDFWPVCDRLHLRHKLIELGEQRRLLLRRDRAPFDRAAELTRVVLEHRDVTVGIAVAGETHLLRLELRAGPVVSVHEDDAVAPRSMSDRAMGWPVALAGPAPRAGSDQQRAGDDQQRRKQSCRLPSSQRSSRRFSRTLRRQRSAGGSRARPVDAPPARSA